MSNLSILSGYSFRKEPTLKLDEILNKVTKREYIEILGKEIKLEAINSDFDNKKNLKRYCVGYYDIETKLGSPCPTQSQINPKFSNCFKCTQKTAFIPIFNNSLPHQYSLKQQKYNLEPHLVYLAYFGNNLYKVGTTHHKRLETRFKEQGAIKGALITKCDTGYISKELETRIGRTFNIKEIVTSKQKVNALMKFLESKNSSNKTQQLQNSLFSKTENDSCFNNEDFYLIRKKNDILNHLSLHEIDSKIYDFLDIYMIEELNFNFLKQWDMKKNIEGKVVGMIGDNLLVKDNSSKNYIFPIKKNLGMVYLRVK